MSNVLESDLTIYFSEAEKRTKIKQLSWALFKSNSD